MAGVLRRRGLTWDQVYEGEHSSHGWTKQPWRSDSPLKYYWEGKTPPLVEPLPGSFSGGENHSVTAEGLRLHDALPNEPFDAELRASTIRASLEHGREQPKL